MTASKIDWKSSQVLKVFGTTIREGTFKGSRPTNMGTITNDEPTNFTPEYIEMLFNNAKSPVPFVLSHKTGRNDAIGFAYKFGVNENKDDLKYEGFNFDKDAIRKITTEGYDYVSPEIVEEKDASGKVTNAYIKQIAFVQSPYSPMGAAIDGTQVSMEPIVFSKGTDNNTVDNTMTDENNNSTDTNGSQTETKTVVKDTVISPAPQVVTPTVDKPVVANTPSIDINVDSMRKELDDYKSKVEVLSKHNEKMLNEQYNNIVNEIKTLGVDDPASIVKGLGVEQKLEVLGKLKGTLAKTRPMTAATESTTTASQTNDKDASIDAALKSLGYSKTKYEELIKNTR
jgi:hypothetical protein